MCRRRGSATLFAVGWRCREGRSRGISRVCSPASGGFGIAIGAGVETTGVDAARGICALTTCAGRTGLAVDLISAGIGVEIEVGGVALGGRT